jgi:hypothetical protein
MAAVELAVIHVVARLAQGRHEAAAARIDRQHAVRHPVRDEDLRRPVGLDRGREARREGEDVAEQLAVRDPDRERVGRPVREAPDRDAGGIDRVAPEHEGERPVQEGHVGAEAAEDHVPGAPARIRRQDEDAPRLRDSTNASTSWRPSPPAPWSSTRRGAGRAGS